MQDNSWLKQLKAGDQVVVVFCYGLDKGSIETVQRITPSGKWVVVRGTKYDTKNGICVGDRLFSKIKQATPEAIRAIEYEEYRRDLLAKIPSTFRNFSTGALEKIVKIIEEDNLQS